MNILSIDAYPFKFECMFFVCIQLSWRNPLLNPPVIVSHCKLHLTHKSIRHLSFYTLFHFIHPDRGCIVFITYRYVYSHVRGGIHFVCKELTGQHYPVSSSYFDRLHRRSLASYPQGRYMDHHSTMSSVPSASRPQPRMDLSVNCSCRITAARIIVMTTLSLSIGTTLEASPICSAL